MKLKRINSLISLSVFATAVLPLFVQAKTSGDTCAAGSTGVTLCTGNYTVLGVVTKITSWVELFLGAVAVLFIIYGGFQYMTAAGNEKQAETAKQTLTYAVIGLIVILLATVIVQLVGSSLSAVAGS